MPRHVLNRRVTAALAVLVTTATTLVAGPAPAQAAPAPDRVGASAAAPDGVGTTSFAATDYCLGECADILPPGQNGNATLVEVLGNQAFGTLPRHSGDQLGKYANLVYGYAGLREDQLGNFFNDASFGVPPGQAERTYSPRADVTIVRDRSTGVPHITGTTRGGTMYGAGFAGAEDRLFTMDLLRHVGRGTLTPFAGAPPATGRSSRASGATRRTPRRTSRPRSRRCASAARAASSSTPTYASTSTGSTRTSVSAWPTATAPASTCSPGTWTRSPTRVARSGSR